MNNITPAIGFQSKLYATRIIHSIRHVAASLYLRKNRQDWDDYQTVRKTYAHLSEVEETTNLEQKMELQLGPKLG